MERIHSFPPVAASDAKCLILGSMPGAASLKAGQYYAMKRNAFWPLIESIFGTKFGLTYEERKCLLLKNKIALWDVLADCVRPGSLDSAIREECANDFASFLKEHSCITHIYFNGQPARKLFEKHVLKTIPSERYVLNTLPSTSPANAGWSRDRKRDAWTCILMSL